MTFNLARVQGIGADVNHHVPLAWYFRQPTRMVQTWAQGVYLSHHIQAIHLSLNPRYTRRTLSRCIPPRHALSNVVRGGVNLTARVISSIVQLIILAELGHFIHGSKSDHTP